MRKLAIAAIAAGSALLAAGVAAAQSAPLDMRCEALAGYDLATSPGVIYYVAGYHAGTLGGMAGGPGADGAGAASAVATHGGDPAATPPGEAGAVPELAVEAIAEGCRAAPDATVVEMIEKHGAAN